jgi:hypothetical protein
LLGVDFKNRGTALPEMFAREVPKHLQEAVVDEEYFKQLREAINHVKYITIIVPLFLAMRSDSDAVVECARAVPRISDATITKALELDYPLEEFLLYNMVEGFLYQSKQSRTDKETTKSLRPDLGVREEGQKMLQDYLLERYTEDYEYRLKQMAGEEKKILMDDHIRALVNSETMSAFSHLLAGGAERGAVQFQIANANSQGCLELHAALMDKELIVPKRAEKLYVFYTGEDLDDDTKAVWNGGNGYRTSTKPLQKLLEEFNEGAMWDRIKARFASKISHVYRSCSNRHGHSNSFPSYFAFGHDLLLSFVCVSSEEVWLEYKKMHSNCCGVQDALANPKGLSEAVRLWNEKRDRRTECENDKAKMEAAIDRKKARQAHRRANPKQKLQTLARKRAASAGTSDSDSDGSDSNMSY